MRAPLLPGLPIWVTSLIFTMDNEKEDTELSSKESDGVGSFVWQDIPPCNSFCKNDRMME